MYMNLWYWGRFGGLVKLKQLPDPTTSCRSIVWGLEVGVVQAIGLETESFKNQSKKQHPHRCSGIFARGEPFSFINAVRSSMVVVVDSHLGTSIWFSRARSHVATFRLRRRALWATEVGQPGTAVELAVGGLDLVQARRAGVGRWLNNESVEALDLLGSLEGNPSEDDGVARVPQVQHLERNRGLRTLAGDEGGLGGEGQGSERDGSVSAAVDQGVDRVGLVVIVGRKDSQGEVGRVVGEQRGEVIGDDLGVRVTQAEGISGLGPAVSSNGGAGEEGSSPGEDGGRTHADGRRV